MFCWGLVNGSSAPNGQSNLLEQWFDILKNKIRAPDYKTGIYALAYFPLPTDSVEDNIDNSYTTLLDRSNNNIDAVLPGNFNKEAQN